MDTGVSINIILVECSKRIFNEQIKSIIQCLTAHNFFLRIFVVKETDKTMRNLLLCKDFALFILGIVVAVIGGNIRKYISLMCR